MVDALKRLHLRKEVRLNPEVLPPNFPLKLLGLQFLGWYILPLLGFLVESDYL